MEAFHTRPGESFSLAVSGGDTARRCYERLAADGADQIDWWQVDVYWGDERCVPPDHPDSNERLVREALLERVGAANAVYPMRCDEGPDAYQQRVATVGRFDLVHLGLGPDGHTASLFPDSPALDADPGRLVVMNEDPHGRNPHRRMTLTYSGIARARLVIFTVEGEAKREAFARVRAGDLACPAARVRAERIVWLVDPAAAGDGRRTGGLPPPTSGDLDLLLHPEGEVGLGLLGVVVVGGALAERADEDVVARRAGRPPGSRSRPGRSTRRRRSRPWPRSGRSGRARIWSKVSVTPGLRVRTHDLVGLVGGVLQLDADGARGQGRGQALVGVVDGLDRRLGAGAVLLQVGVDRVGEPVEVVVVDDDGSASSRNCRGLAARSRRPRP